MKIHLIIFLDRQNLEILSTVSLTEHVHLFMASYQAVIDYTYKSLC